LVFNRNIDNKVEMNIQTCVSYWFSFVVLKLAGPQARACFRNLEKTSRRLKKTELHQKFNEIYIYILCYK